MDPLFTPDSDTCVYMCLQKSEKNNGPQRNDEVQGLNDEGPGLYVHLKKRDLVGRAGRSKNG